MKRMLINKDRLEKFMKNLPNVEAGKTTHYNLRENVIYLEREWKEKSLWHEMGHAFLSQYKAYKILYFLGANMLFVVFTVFLAAGTILLIGSKIWETKYILFPLFCVLMIAIDEIVASCLGRALKREAGSEILKNLKKTLKNTSNGIHEPF